MLFNKSPLSCELLILTHNQKLPLTMQSLAHGIHNPIPHNINSTVQHGIQEARWFPSATEGRL